MNDIRLLLLGISITLSSGFILVHDLIRHGIIFGSITESGSIMPIPYIGVLLGLTLSLIAFLYGTFYTS